MSRLAWLAAALVVLAAATIALALPGGPLRPDADESLPPLDASALRVEQQLLCPQCTNKRLDVCELPICDDMRREIRARLERGESEREVVDYFGGRFGDRVRAAVPKSGFNLWLWAWAGGSVLIVGLAGVSWLTRQRRRAPAAPPDSPAATGAPDEFTDRWLDAQLREGSVPGSTPGPGA